MSTCSPQYINDIVLESLEETQARFINDDKVWNNAKNEYLYRVKHACKEHKNRFIHDGLAVMHYCIDVPCNWISVPSRFMTFHFLQLVFAKLDRDEYTKLSRQEKDSILAFSFNFMSRSCLPECQMQREYKESYNRKYYGFKQLVWNFYKMLGEENRIENMTIEQDTYFSDLLNLSVERVNTNYFHTLFLYPVKKEDRKQFVKNNTNTLLKFITDDKELERCSLTFADLMRPYDMIPLKRLIEKGWTVEQEKDKFRTHLKACLDTGLFIKQ